MKVIIIGTAALLAFTSALAQDSAAKSKEEMQRALNQQVMSAPFNPGDEKKAHAYAEEAKKQNVVPQQAPPTYWQPGWTCASMATYQYYNYMHYRNCVYYHHYYGRYW